MKGEGHGLGFDKPKRIEFSDLKKASFEKNLTPEISEVIEKSGHKMFDPYFDKDGNFEGYVVGAVTGVEPQLIIAKPNEDGTEIVDTLNIPALLRHAVSEEERRIRLEHLKKLHGGIYEEGNRRIDIRMADFSAWMEELSELVAENKWREYMNTKGFLKRAVAHIDEDSYRHKFYLDTLHAIQTNRNLKASLEARVFGRGAVQSDDPYVQETLAEFDTVLTRFADGIHDEEERGDRFIADPKLNSAATDLFIAHAMGEVSDRTSFDRVVEEKIIPLMEGRSFSKGGLTTASEKENRMHASNLWHWSEVFKEQIQQLMKDAQEQYGEKDIESIKRYTKGLLGLDFKFELYKVGRSIVNRDPYGELKPGQHPVTKFSRSERAVSFLQKNIGWSPANKILGAVVANPVAMGIVGALAGRAGVRMAATVVAGTALGTFLAAPTTVIAASLAGGTFAAGLFARIRAQKELKQDRGTIARDMALGRTAGGDRAKKMETYVHEMKSAEDLIEALQKVTGEELEGSPERQAALDLIADVRARLEIRIQYAKDTIRVSAEEGEKTLTLSHAIEQIKREMKRIGPELAGKDAEMAEIIEKKKTEILAQIKKTDEEFAEYLKKESMRKTIKGAALGLLGGAISAGVHYVADSELFKQSVPGQMWAATGGRAIKAVGSAWNATGGRVVNAVGGVASDTWTATKGLVSYLFGGSSAPVPNAAAMHGGVFDFIDQPRGVKDVPFGKGVLRLPENRFFIDEGNGNGHIVTAFGRQVGPSIHVNPDGSVMEPSATGEWKQLFERVTHHISGQEFSQELHENTLSNGVVVNNFTLPKNMEIFEDVNTHTFEIRDNAGNIIERGLTLGADGKLSAASVALLKEHGWNIGEQTGYVVDKVTELSKGELAKYLKENYGQSVAHRIDWHANGTPMHKVGGHWVATYVDSEGVPHSLPPTNLKPPAAEGWVAKHIGGRWMGADGKELQLKLEGNPDSRVLSLKDMIKQSIAGKHNLDGSIDEKFGDFGPRTEGRGFAEAARNFKLRVFVGNNYTGSGESFELPVDSNGELHIDKNHPLYGVLFDKAGNLKATVEAVIPEADGSGYHTLATAVRHGDGAGFINEQSSSITLSHPPVETSQDIYSFNEPTGPTPTPTVVPDDEIPLIFPIPWFPRDQMETPKLDENDKQRTRRSPKKPMTPPPYRSNEQLSRALVKDNFFEKTILESGKRRRRIEAGEEDLSEQLMETAIETFAENNGIKLTSASRKNLRLDLEKARDIEALKPLEWTKGFSIDYLEKSAKYPKGVVLLRDAKGRAYPISEIEKRLAFARPRPENITLSVSQELRDKFPDSDDNALRLSYAEGLSERFGTYGVGLKFASKRS